jgi:ABC-2 type transport system permease protein
MNYIEAWSGALMYEFRMQIRRRSVWLVFIALGLFFTQFHQPWNRPLSAPASAAIVYWTGIVQSFLAVAFGIVVADRLRRDRQTKVEELFNTLPGAVSARMFGKYLGSTLATLIPVIAVYSVGVVYILVRWHAIQALPLALAAFAAIALPGILFIAACSIAFPAILWVPLYQILFVGYWFWGNLLPDVGIPTLSSTIHPYTRWGLYMYSFVQSSWTGRSLFSRYPGRDGSTGYRKYHTSPGSGYCSHSCLERVPQVATYPAIGFAMIHYHCRE